MKHDKALNSSKESRESKVIGGYSFTLYGPKMFWLVRSTIDVKVKVRNHVKNGCPRKSTDHLIPLVGRETLPLVRTDVTPPKRGVRWLVHSTTYKSHTHAFSSLANNCLVWAFCIEREDGTSCGTSERSGRIAHQIHVGRRLWRIHLRMLFAQCDTFPKTTTTKENEQEKESGEKNLKRKLQLARRSSRNPLKVPYNELWMIGWGKRNPPYGSMTRCWWKPSNPNRKHSPSYPWRVF